MCGICGFYAPENKSLLRKMTDSLFHRGPDSSGFYSDIHCSLGMRRLSIIDKANGQQPICNETEDTWIVFNGEIYNYRELKSKLQNHLFKTNSDTEVILHAYDEYGEFCLTHLNGMFAFAIWDLKNKKLFIARDRFGEKPLYYTFVGKKLFFASEIKALLQNPEIKRNINLFALEDYLSFRCNSNQETFFKGIFKLPPAHYLIYDGKKCIVKKYWELSVTSNYSLSLETTSNLLFTKLKESVKSRLMSEVPLGAYLSGGVDSGAIVGLMSTLSKEPVKTFTAGFGNEFDEFESARDISDHFHTDHQEILIKMDAIDLLPKVVWHLDEPLADPTCIPIYLLSEKIKPHATVVLTGDGSDEIFYGYEQHKLLYLYQKYMRKLPLSVRKKLPFLVKMLPKEILKRFFRYATLLGDKGVERFKTFISS